MSERGDGPDDWVSPDRDGNDDAETDAASTDGTPGEWVSSGSGGTADRGSGAGNDDDWSPERRGPQGTSGSGDGSGSFLDDFLSSVIAVVGIGILLFAISGIWPPMVAIESPSMEPNIDTGDLVFVMDEHRFAPDTQTGDTGVVTAYTGRQDDVSYYTFRLPGDVIVYKPDGSNRATPVIHRAVFWVDEGENWYPKAQQRFLPSDVNGCSEMEFCPAPHGGFITLGDNNPQYDQVEDPSAVSEPVKPEWVIGTAEFRLPGLGWLRLRAATVAPVGLVGPAAKSIAGASA